MKIEDKMRCPYCGWGKLGYVGSKTWECSVCFRLSVILLNPKRRSKNDKKM